jgi:hypothetical protein
MMKQVGNEEPIKRPEEKKSFGRPQMDERKILKYFVKKQNARVWTGFGWLKV